VFGERSRTGSGHVAAAAAADLPFRLADGAVRGLYLTTAFDPASPTEPRLSFTTADTDVAAVVDVVGATVDDALSFEWCRRSMRRAATSTRATSRCCVSPARSEGTGRRRSAGYRRRHVRVRRKRWRRSASARS
jgi:hypothetical protein